MYSYATSSRSSTLDSLDSLNRLEAHKLDVQVLDARFIDPDKLQPRLQHIFQTPQVELKLKDGKWHIFDAPKLSEEDELSLRL